MKKKSIGIVTNYREESQLFNNGLFQNIYTLCAMLQADGSFDVAMYVGVMPSDLDPKNPVIAFAGLNIRVIVLKEVVDGNLPVPDLFIEVGSPIPDNWLEKLYERNPRLKAVPLLYGNNLMMHIEDALKQPKSEESKGKRGVTLINSKLNRDIVWTSPHYAESMQYLKWRFDAKKVTIAPFVWSSQYIDHTIKTNSNLQMSEDFGRVAVIEPNLNVTKNSVVPIATIDAASQKSDSVKKGLIFCAEHWRTDPYNQKWISDLQVYKNGKLTFNSRYRFMWIFSKGGYNCGTLLSHQFHNGLNYVYLEALHLGIPLVHNSEFIKEAGYYYEGWNVSDGADALIRAVETGREGMTSEYKEIAKQTLWKYSPHNPDNVKGYIDLIKEALDS